MRALVDGITNTWRWGMGGGAQFGEIVCDRNTGIMKGSSTGHGARENIN